MAVAVHHIPAMSPLHFQHESEVDNELPTDYFARPFDDLDDNKEQDASPKAFNDSWRLTPSFMDTNPYAFSAFANQQHGYYTPTPGGLNTLYHSQAGDLHTPRMGMHTPISMPHSVHGLHAPDSAMHLQHFNPHMLHHQNVFHDPFGQQQHQQQAFPPQQFLQHQDSGYAAMDDHSHKTTPSEMAMAPPNIHSGAHQMMPGSFSMPHIPQGEKYVDTVAHNYRRNTNQHCRFRFHTTLNAPTAMIKHSDEIPVTYLNKGQAYTLSVYDTTPPMPQSNVPVKYRTYVRISFEDEQQRARPGSCWQLWKEGRGSNEAHQRGGKLLAVEYVDPNQGGDDSLRKSQVEVERASFDGFVVTWYPNPTAGVPDCSISVRFNFLSTDFSHSKGVKGIPVRLCAKTELISPQSSSINDPEVCFSKVKLFRDHGAERKLSNDVAHVKKTIEKLKQQILQAEQGLGNSGKRKRSESASKPASSKPGKVVKHKRTWSVDSDVEVGRSSAEEDLHTKLVSMQDMFSSTRPVSVLFLRGEAQDDPDLHPVKLSGGETLEGITLKRSTTWESHPSVSESPASNAGSPSASSASQSTPKRKYSEMMEATIQEEAEDDDEVSKADIATGTKLSPRPVKVPKLEGSTKEQSEILALDIDNSYEAPIEKPTKPGKFLARQHLSRANNAAVACFYVRQKDGGNEYYRAVYLFQRTVHDLINCISQKFEIDPMRVTQITHVNSKGLHIVVDEDVVREVPEGQDMLVDFLPTHQDHAVKHEQAPFSVLMDGIIDPIDSTVSDPLEMWLNY